MKHMRYWLSSKRRLIAQLQEARDERDSLDRACDIVCEQVRREESDHKYTTAQLHRVARERDKERELRLAAEDRRDVYLEQLANVQIVLEALAKLKETNNE